MRVETGGLWLPGRRSCGCVIALLSAALMVAGCGHTSNYAYPGSYVGAPVPAAATEVARVEVESDGLPSQIPPRVGRRLPDDPREPWSPNYGAAPAVVQNPAPRAASVVTWKATVSTATAPTEPRHQAPWTAIRVR